MFSHLVNINTTFVFSKEHFGVWFVKGEFCVFIFFKNFNHIILSQFATAFHEIQRTAIAFRTE